MPYSEIEAFAPGGVLLAEGKARKHDETWMMLLFLRFFLAVLVSAGGHIKSGKQ